MGIFLVGTVLFAGLLALSATKTKAHVSKLPPPRPSAPATAEPTAEVPTVELSAKKAFDNMGAKTVELYTEDLDVGFNEDRKYAYVHTEQLPIDLVVGVPSGFFIPSLAVDPPNEVTAGTPGESDSFVVRVNEYAAGPDAEGLYERDDASVLLAAAYKTGPDTSTHVPLRIFVVP